MEAEVVSYADVLLTQQAKVKVDWTHTQKTVNITSLRLPLNGSLMVQGKKVGLSSHRGAAHLKSWKQRIRLG